MLQSQDAGLYMERLGGWRQQHGLYVYDHICRPWISYRGDTCFVLKSVLNPFFLFQNLLKEKYL